METDNLERVTVESRRNDWHGQAITWRTLFWTACVISILLELYNIHAQNIMADRIDTLTYNYGQCVKVLDGANAKIGIEIIRGK